MSQIIPLILVSFIAFSCTDAQRSKIGSLGDGASVKCYSGGVVIYDGVSTGKVQSEAQSDGYYFRDANTGISMEVSGNCVIRYDR